VLRDRVTESQTQIRLGTVERYTSEKAKYRPSRVTTAEPIVPAVSSSVIPARRSRAKRLMPEKLMAVALRFLALLLKATTLPSVLMIGENEATFPGPVH